MAQEGSKARKVPYYIDGHRRRGAQGRPADVERLGSFRKAKTVAASGDYAGLGMAMLPGRGLVALDFDNCVDGTNTVMPEVLALVSGTYAELSPSGHGVRAFYRDPQGVLSAFGNGKSLGDGLPFGFELFQSKGFVTVTASGYLKARQRWLRYPPPLRRFASSAWVNRRKRCRPQRQPWPRRWASRSNSLKKH